jgi:hypothetical protein
VVARRLAEGMAKRGHAVTVLTSRHDRRSPPRERLEGARIRSQEFELVVLVEPLEPLDRSWWNEEHFGSDVVGAIDRAYRFAGRVEGYYLYEPRNEVLAP